MYEELQALKNQVNDLQNKIADLESLNNSSFLGLLDDSLIERTFKPSLSGSPSTNGLLRTIGSGGATILAYPTEMIVYRFKGKRFAVPTYDITTLTLP